MPSLSAQPHESGQSSKYEHQSKTHFATLRLGNVEQPELLLIPIEVYTHSTDDKKEKKHLLSRGLRQEAISRYIDAHETLKKTLKLNPKHLAIKFHAERRLETTQEVILTGARTGSPYVPNGIVEPASVENGDDQPEQYNGNSSRSVTKIIDYLIVPTTNQTKSAKIAIANSLEPMALDINTKANDLGKNARNTPEIVCALSEIISDPIGPGDPRYWRCLELLLRSHMEKAQLITRKKEYLHRSLPVLSKADLKGEKLPSGADKPLEFFKQDRKGVQVLMRRTLSIEEGECSLRLDLVPSITTEQSLSEFLSMYYGPSFEESSFDQNIASIKRMFMGLDVRRSYSNTSDTDYQGQDLAEDPESLSHSPPKGFSPPRHINITKSGRGRRGVILDVKLPKDVGRFNVKMESGESKSFSVNTYFNEFKFHGKCVLKHPNLPLAQLAGSVWIPLELLYPTYDQAIHGLSHMTTTIREDGHRDLFSRNGQGAFSIKNHLKVRLDKLAEEFREQINRSAEFEMIDPEGDVDQDEFLLVDDAASIANTHHKEARKVRIKSRGESAQNVGIIIVSPPNVSAIESKELCRQLKIRLSASNSGRSWFNEDMPTSIVPEATSLLLEKNWASPVLEEFLTGSLDVIVGVIDERGRSPEELNEIRAALQKFGNKRAGAVTYTTTKATLEKQFQVNQSNTSYFPFGILRKVNFMAGGTTYEHEEDLKSLEKSHTTIVAGAHVSHPPSGAARNCPSVTAVTANINPNMLHFPGSARVQRTMVKGGPKTDICAEIVDLEDMMIERFELWKKKNLESHNPTVVFYRDGIASTAEDVFNREKSAIRKAYEQVFSQELHSLSYIVLSKSKDITPARQKRANGWNGSSDETQDFTINEGGSTKGYKYVVVENGLGWPLFRYEQLTNELNGLCQYAPKVAFALPVFYAHKLCDRMFQYFPFAITNKFDAVPAIARMTNDKSMTQFVRRHITGFGSLEEDGSILPGDRKEVEKSDKWHNPWLDKLNETMFYL